MSVILPKRLQVTPVLSLYHHLVDTHQIPRKRMPAWTRDPVARVDLESALRELTLIHANTHHRPGEK